MNNNMLILKRFPNVSILELDKIRQINDHHGRCDTVIETSADLLHQRRENEKINGRDSALVGPLSHMLSVRFLAFEDRMDREQQPLTAYGNIYFEFSDVSSGQTIVHHLYTRNRDDPEIIGPSGALTLTNPDVWSTICMPLHKTSLVVDVSVGGRSLAARYICCAAEDTTDFDKVKIEHVPIDLGVLALRYVAMPFALYGHVEVRFYRKQGENIIYRFINVKGKIVARYGHTYGSYDSECTLFNKQSNEFQRVGLDLSRTANIELSRIWVALPVYSTIILDLDLLEFGTERKIVKETVEFRVENQMVSYANFIVDDILINVGVRWCSPLPQGRHIENKYCMETEEDEASDKEMTLQGITSKDDDSDDEMNEARALEASWNLKHVPWLRAHRSKLYPSPAVEIFSILIGRRESPKPMQIYGCIQVSCVDGCTSAAFKREANDAFELSEECKTIPVQNGCLVYDEDSSLEIKMDIKDLDSRLHIRGYVKDWNNIALEFGTELLNKQLCSVVEGENGFAAIHYSIFPRAVGANISGVLRTPNLNSGNGVKVYGSIIARYNNFDYTCGYNKKYYTVPLFKRKKQYPAQASSDGTMALSRSTVVVPLNSSLVIEVDLLIGDAQVSLQGCTEEVEVPTGAAAKEVIVEKNGYSLGIYVKWADLEVSE